MEPERGEMHLLAAGFEDEGHARAAEAELRSMLDVEGADIAVRDVGGSREFVNGYCVVLAGRIRATVVPEVEATFRRHGGGLLTDIPEAWTGTSPAA
jgi:hypothetical protein